VSGPGERFSLGQRPQVASELSLYLFLLAAFNLRLRAAGRAIGVGKIVAHGLRQSAATILRNQLGKDLRQIQELLRHKNIRTTVRYTQVRYEESRHIIEALSQTLE
jgi:site-specific recombinase XerD